MADCHDWGRPGLTNHVTDESGNQWHLRCLDSRELDGLDPAEIQR